MFLAKIHSIADIDSIGREQHAGQHQNLIPFDIIPRHSEKAIRDAIGDKMEAFIQDMVHFAMVSC